MQVSVEDIQNEYKKFEHFSSVQDYQIALTVARRCAEFVCREVYITEFKQEPNKMMLENYLHLFKQKRIMNDKILAFLSTIQTHGNFAIHANPIKPDKNIFDSTAPSLKGLLEWFCTTYHFDTGWIQSSVSSQNSYLIQNQPSQTNYRPSNQITHQTTQQTGATIPTHLMIYLDDRSKTRKDGWMFWLVFDGKDFIKLAGSRLSKSQRIYEMYYRFSGHTLIEKETSDRDVFSRWFQASFGQDPFQSPEYAGRKMNQVDPNQYFTGPRESLWKDTALLYRNLCAESLTT